MKIALAIAAITASLAISSPAVARDNLNENCISSGEFFNMPIGMTLNELETWADARGVVVHTQQQGRYMIREYRWCGYTKSNGFYQVFYAQSQTTGRYKAIYITRFDFRDPHLTRSL